MYPTRQVLARLRRERRLSSSTRFIVLIYYITSLSTCVLSPLCRSDIWCHTLNLWSSLQMLKRNEETKQNRAGASPKSEGARKETENSVNYYYYNTWAALTQRRRQNAELMQRPRAGIVHSRYYCGVRDILHFTHQTPIERWMTSCLR